MLFPNRPILTVVFIWLILFQIGFSSAEQTDGNARHGSGTAPIRLEDAEAYYQWWRHSHAGQGKLSIPEVFQESRKSVVMLMGSDSNGELVSLGSGFVVADGYKVATALHVIQGASSIAVKFSSGTVTRASRVFALDQGADLAVLTLERKGIPLVVSVRQPDVGEEIVAIGNPKGLEGSLSNGIVAAVRSLDTPSSMTFYQITAPISPGSSGGPVLDLYGKVIGVASCYYQGGQNLNFASPSTCLAKLLESRAPTMLLANVPPMTKLPRPAIRQGSVEVIQGKFEYNMGSGELSGSVMNRSDRTIRDVVVLATFFGYTETEENTPEALKAIKQRESLMRSYDLKSLPSDSPIKKKYMDLFFKSLESVTRRHFEKEPSHYVVFTVPNVVPPHLAVRFYHNIPHYEKWEPTFKVLDYDIIQE